MASRRFVIGGGAALAALFARLRRRPAPEPPPEPPREHDDEEAGDELAAEEVLELREALRRELERLTRASRAHSAEPSASGWADIKASRTRSERRSAPG